MCYIPSPCCYHPPVLPMGLGFGFGCNYGFTPLSYGYGCGGYFSPMAYSPCNLGAHLGWHTGAALGMGIGAIINRFC